MKRHTLTLIALLSSALLALGITGCKKTNSKPMVAFVTNASADFWTYAEAGILKAEKEFGDIEVAYMVGDASASKQREIVEGLLARGAKAIAISPVDAAGQADLISKWAKQVPVICCDNDATNSDRLFYLGTDNIAAGRKAGKLVKKALPDGGKIMAFVGKRESANAQERFQGLKDELAGTNIEVLGLMTDGADQGKARANAENALATNKDLAAMVGLWGYNPPNILKALEGMDKLGNVKVIGFDEDYDTLRAIDAGTCTGTVAQQPFIFGYESVKYMRELVVNGKTVDDLDLPENKLVYIPTLVIEEGGGADYLKKCDELKASAKGTAAKDEKEVDLNDVREAIETK